MKSQSIKSQVSKNAAGSQQGHTLPLQPVLVVIDRRRFLDSLRLPLLKCLSYSVTAENQGQAGEESAKI